MICTWGQLAQLRSNGQRPAMTLIVTTSRRFAWDLGELGAMAILHQRGEPMPVELLDGLDVMLHLDNCDQNTAVLRLIAAKAVGTKRVQCWCSCFGSLENAAAPCKDMRQTITWFESLPAGAPRPKEAA